MSNTMILDRPLAARPGLSTTPRPRSGEVRLTRRGRLVVFALCLLAVAATVVLLAGGSVATRDAGTPERTEEVVVHSGQTLWSIAAQYADDGDVPAMVEHLQHINALSGGMLRAGQHLLVPAE